VPWFAAESKHLKFAVYCGHLPKSWHIPEHGLNDAYDHGGWLTATYQGPSGAKLFLQEGAFCSGGASACSPHDTDVGLANFGDLSGELYTLGPGLGYAIYVNAGTSHGYTATGTNVSQATFVSIVASLVLVPKS
jgi:hypothetical protein